MDRPRAGLVSLEFLLYGSHHAEVAELADALASGASPGNRVEVRVLSSALSFALECTRRLPTIARSAEVDLPHTRQIRFTSQTTLAFGLAPTHIRPS